MGADVGEDRIEIIHSLDFIHTEVQFGVVKINQPGRKVQGTIKD